MTNKRSVLEDAVILNELGIDEIEEVIAPGITLAE